MNEVTWGSDAVAAVLRELHLKYAALVPGASYRGLHDSIVNYLNNDDPQMLLCLHEEHSVAIAHGYAKVTGEPMLAIVHSNVGLMHASMAIFDAFCDRCPVVVLGANGPVDAMKRRPWIDWIHTSQDMGALVRPYTKWDDQPLSVGAAYESILRAYQIAATPPRGPTYVVLDAGLQEEKLPDGIPPLPDVSRFRPPSPPIPAPSDVARAIDLLKKATKPLISIGRGERTMEAWTNRIALAEALNARVVIDFKTGSMFPSEHPLCLGSGALPAGSAALKEADVVLDLDSVDLAGAFKSAFGRERVPATVISASQDRYIHNGWSMDYQGLPPADIALVVAPDVAVAAIIDALGRPAPKLRDNGKPAKGVVKNGVAHDETIGIAAMSAELGAAFASEDVCFIRLPIGVSPDDFKFNHPLHYLGGDGGGGIGSGPGMSVGAALALKGTGRLPVAVLGDGDYLMGVTAFWTAVQSEIPLLVICSNNRSFFNDEVHQERMAIARHRPIERKWIGQRIDGPAPNLAKFADAQGAIGIGPIAQRSDIAPAIAQGIEHVRAGKVCVIDIIVAPEYDASVAEGVTKGDLAAQAERA